MYGDNKNIVQKDVTFLHKIKCGSIQNFKKYNQNRNRGSLTEITTQRDFYANHIWGILAYINTEMKRCENVKKKITGIEN